MWDCFIWRIYAKSHAMRATHTRQWRGGGENQNDKKVFIITFGPPTLSSIASAAA